MIFSILMVALMAAAGLIGIESPRFKFAFAQAPGNQCFDQRVRFTAGRDGDGVIDQCWQLPVLFVVNFQQRIHKGVVLAIAGTSLLKCNSPFMSILTVAIGLRPRA